MFSSHVRPRLLLLAALLSASSVAVWAQKDVTQPGDPIIASSSNSPGSEGVANAIDGKPTKYLNFDTKIGGKPSGFVVTPSIGVTRVIGMTMQSANDAPQRDPKVVTLEGSNDDTVTDFASGNWEQIVRLDNIPAYTDRFQIQSFFFDNFKAYKHYRWTVVDIQNAPSQNNCCMQIAEVELLGGALPPTVAQPGDPIIASSSNSPGSEGVANAIDGKPTKYLNFDTKIGGKPSGFVVTPSIGKTLVTGISMQSANDAPERDPKVITLEGSNDDTVSDFASGNWELIYRNDNIPPYTDRFQTQTFLFDNVKPYKHYRWTVIDIQNAPSQNNCCMQIAEVQLLGTSAPKDVTQPGDPIIASSSNSPGSEGVANAIDGKPTKYLNFDTKVGGKPSGFVVTPSIGTTIVIGMTMQSANDAPERDPKVVTLEGSNDDTVTDFASGTWELIVRLDNIPPYTDRFQTKEFYFPNKKSFKHYRWTVVDIQNAPSANNCCMQIAEVELLAVSEAADCNKAKFLVQPVDTPVLEGATATFVTTVNGPWPLQWYENGALIPGANTTTYTTPPVTTQNETNIYTVQIVGCEMSSPARAVIFRPSTTKSIGISFRGGGANGAPTLMNTNDVAGLHMQAYWNNAQQSGSGSLPDPDVDPTTEPTGTLWDSDGQASTILFEFQTSGEWGSGTGDATATQRMLNGMVRADNDTSDPSTITFSNVPAGKHSVIAYLVGIPLQFQDGDYKIIGQTEQTIYVRVINADEYNAAPGFYRGVSTDPNKRDLATYVRFDNVSPAADGTIKLEFRTLTFGFDRGVPVNAIQLILNSTAAGAPPVITGEPPPTVIAEGSTATISVTATGDNLTYQWRKDGRTLPNGGNVSGATSASLVIRSFAPADEAVYSVAVFNEGGSVISKNAAIRISKYDIKDALVGYWKLDQSSGTTAPNSVAGEEAAVVNGAPVWVTGQIGNAFSFDGATYLFVPDYPLAKKAISASAWFNVNPAGATDMAIIRNAQGALTVSGGAARIVGQFELGLVLDQTDGQLRPMAAIGIGPNVARAIASAPFQTGWHHIAFSADGAQLRLYVDGAQVAVTDYLADINPPDIPYLSIGARLNVDQSDPPVLGPDANNPNYLLGPADDIALWTRALTAKEVELIYAAGKQSKPVTDVVVPIPTNEPGTLNVALSGSTITVTWDKGTLQTADQITGPWTDSGATSPLTEQATGAAKFYRTISR